MSKLGMQIDEYRKAKRVPEVMLCQEAGISRATYNRFVDDQTSLTLTAFLKLIHLLALDLDDLTDVVDCDDFDLDAAQIRVDACIKAKAVKKYAALEKQMQEYYVLTQNQGFAQLASLLAIYLHAQSGDRQLACAAAGGLWQTLMKQQRWFTFDRRLFCLFAHWLPCAKLREACWQRLGQMSDSASGVHGDLEQADLAYLEKAIAAGDAGEVALADAWLQHQKIPGEDLANRPLLLFSALAAKAACQKADLQGYSKFHQQYQRLFGRNAMLVHYDHLWQQVMQTHFKPAAEHAPIELVSALPAQAKLEVLLTQVRHFRKIHIADLCQEVGISKSTWNRTMRNLMNAKIEVVFRILSMLRLNFTDLERLWTGTANDLKAWLMQLSAFDQAPAGIAALDQIVTQAAITYPQSLVKTLHAEAEIAAGKLLNDQKAVQSAVHIVWTSLDSLGEWTRFEYQLLAPIIKYLDYDKARFLLGRCLQSKADLKTVLPANLTDLLGSELLVAALRSKKSVNIDEALKMMQALKTKQQGAVLAQHFAVMVHATLVDQPEKAASCYRQTRAALGYFTAENSENERLQMLDQLWKFLTEG